MAVEREKMYECQVKRRRVRATGIGYEPFWKLKDVAVALTDLDTEFRCKDCFGAVKLHKKRVDHGPESHVSTSWPGTRSTASVAFRFAMRRMDGRIGSRSSLFVDGCPVMAA